MSLRKPIYMILAVARNGAIGRAGGLPWNLPEDWQYFLEQTRGGILIHGRTSQEHHGAALPGREVIVLSHDPAYACPGARVAPNLAAALETAQALENPGPIWIGGGAALYREALPLADRVYVTEIDADFEADKFFPREWLGQAGFTHVLVEHPGTPGEWKYTFKVLGRAG